MTHNIFFRKTNVVFGTEAYLPGGTTGSLLSWVTRTPDTVIDGQAIVDGPTAVPAQLMPRFVSTQLSEALPQVAPVPEQQHTVTRIRVRVGGGQTNLTETRAGQKRHAVDSTVEPKLPRVGVDNPTDTIISAEIVDDEMLGANDLPPHLFEPLEQSQCGQRRNSVERFTAFTNSLPVFHCSVCCVLMYQTETVFVASPESETSVPCTTWGVAPIIYEEGHFAVCSNHSTEETVWSNPHGFPALVDSTTNTLNYRELSCLSPIKLLCTIGCNSSVNRSVMGHYQLNGNVSGRYNYDFSGYVFAGTLEISYTVEEHDSGFIRTDQPLIELL
ncbi:hypothetical protein BDB00DRAFT_877356 [Zychaea mexicana]|uniref:uncharacterized protein n=1 Tax=Zychaea mexicana TaxID=64656 RepID=UPI0022FE59AF|nr:uncharacterized protein BDB00DRAFT_877356 [Zychaea mexicana]KAI9488475.1 hypothetical protein BDB00DRAFT_877356 [Zychaea mexicana]